MGNTQSEIYNVTDIDSILYGVQPAAGQRMEFHTNFQHNLLQLDAQCSIENDVYVDTMEYWCKNVLVLPMINNIKLMIKLPYSTSYVPNSTVPTPRAVYNESLFTHCDTSDQYQYLLNTICSHQPVIQRILYHMQHYRTVHQLHQCITILVQLIFDCHTRIGTLQSYNILPTLLQIQVDLKIQCGNTVLQTAAERTQYKICYDMVCNILRLIDNTKYKQSIRYTICKGLYTSAQYHEYRQWCQANQLRSGDYSSIQPTVRSPQLCALGEFAGSELFDEQLMHVIFSYIWPHDHTIVDTV